MIGSVIVFPTDEEVEVCIILNIDERRYYIRGQCKVCNNAHHLLKDVKI